MKERSLLPQCKHSIQLHETSNLASILPSFKYIRTFLSENVNHYFLRETEQVCDTEGMWRILCLHCGKWKPKSSSPNFLCQDHWRSIRFTCFICSKEFVHHTLAESCFQSHQTLKYCQYCPEVGFVNERRLNIHIRSEHMDKLPFKCDVDKCKAAFLTKKKMSDHKRIVHSNKILSCPYCDFKTKYKSCHKRHMDSCSKK